ncbi:MAG: ribosome small subunit-dependent GTPase A [Phycisphaerae bacterium]|nr:ribosome small subunit-dependent GTPase A [Phycisphaerae bacterium]
MARGKGKSRRRRKDWHARWEAGKDIHEPKRQRLRPPEVKLGEGSFATGQASELDSWQQISGMVTGVFRRGTFVRVDGEELYCGIAKTFRPPEGFEHTSPLAVGDACTVALVPDDLVDGQVELDRNRMDGMILSREPRRTVLARPEPRSDRRRDEYDEEDFLKVIAANMDVLMIVAATHKPALSAGLIERFRIIAERGGLQALLVLNKIDLGEPDAQAWHSVELLDLEVLRVSAAAGLGLPALRDRLAGQRTVLAGASGVGKTTLINAIIPDIDAATNTVRAKDQRGRHTTSQARVYNVPHAQGGLIIDTPGIRELDVGLRIEDLPWYFPEIEAVAPDCKFRDCSHTHEPGCAVQAAVEAGEIPPRRFESYLRMRDTVQ